MWLRPSPIASISAVTVFAKQLAGKPSSAST